MRDTTRIFIPIPKVRNTHCKVEIGGDDQTSRVIDSKFVYPTTTGIGTFSLILSNAHGQLTGKYFAGDVVKFYADNVDNTTLQFLGRIDFVKDDIGENGQFLEIEGRHRAYLLTEFLICHSVTNTSPAQILKDDIDKLPTDYGFTYTNVSSDTDSMNVEWNHKPFWDCIFELCKHSGFDCYVDNDLDFHYFEANSIGNANDAIVEGDNFIKTKGWGTDDTYEKTRVTVMGQNEGGLPVIYTAISDGEGDDIKEVFIRDGSADTNAKVKDIAEAKLEEMTNRNPQARITSHGLETIKPGENIPILIPRQKIHGEYKIIQLTHKFGAKVGGWRTECLIEEEETGVSRMIYKVSQQTRSGIKSDNPNKMLYSYNFDFDDDSGTHSSTAITEGRLKTDGGASGTWTSDSKSLDIDAEHYEVRVIGEALVGTKYYVSVDGGITWPPATLLRTMYTFPAAGKNLKVKVTLNSANTQINTLVVLFK